MVTWREVNSSNVQRVGWFRLGDACPIPCMIVTFRNGATYMYIGVRRQRAVAMTRADSVGRYFIENIRNKFDYIKVSG